MQHTINDPKTIRAWTMYDWANSAYSLVITSSIFPIYYAANTPAIVNFLGWNVSNTVLYSYALSFSFLLVAILSPILSGIADYAGNKKNYMKFFAYMGSLSCMGLYFFRYNNIEYGIICATLASIGFAGSIVFYNSYLPEIASPDQHDRVSAKGFSMGYIGSVILMVFILTMILMPQWYFGVDGKMKEILAANPGTDPAEALKQAKDSFAGPASRIGFFARGNMVDRFFPIHIPSPSYDSKEQTERWEYSHQGVQGIAQCLGANAAHAQVEDLPYWVLLLQHGRTDRDVYGGPVW